MGVKVALAVKFEEAKGSPDTAILSERPNESLAYAPRSVYNEKMVMMTDDVPYSAMVGGDVRVIAGSS